MASLRALIVDDEPLAAERLVHLCAGIDGVEAVGVAGNGLAALARVEDLRPDVLLLDISMPGLDGVSLARRIASYRARPAIVFITAHANFAVEAFDLAATDYLLKPVSSARLERALARVAAGRLGETAPRRDFLNEIWVPRGREMRRVAVETLDLVQAERDYVRLHAGGTTFLVRMTLRDLEGRLDPDRFLRVHRSTLVAADRIVALGSNVAGGWTVSLSSGHRLRVGRSFRTLVRGIIAAAAPDQPRTAPSCDHVP